MLEVLLVAPSLEESNGANVGFLVDSKIGIAEGCSESFEVGEEDPVSLGEFDLLSLGS